MKDFIELRRVLAIIGGHIWSVVLLGALAAGVGLLISSAQPRVYQATTTMLVGQFNQTTSVNRTDIQTSVDVAKTYADIALRQPVLSAVVDALQLDQSWQDLKKQVQVKIVDGTQLLEVTAEAASPAAARAIADTVAEQLIAISPTTVDNTESSANYTFIRQQRDSLKQRLTDGNRRLQEIDAAIAAAPSPTPLAQLQAERASLEQSLTEWLKNYTDLSTVARDERAATNSLTIIEPAQATNEPVRPRIPLDTVIAGVVGVLLAVALAFLRAYFDSGIHSAEELKEALALTPLAEIAALPRSGWSFRRNTDPRRRSGSPAAGERGRTGEPASRTLITLERPRSAQSESFRTLRTNIQFTSPDSPLRSLVVTSAAPAEGKTFIAANLAVVMAQLGKRVVLVDADLRRPTIHTVFGLPNTVGFTNLILADDLAGGALEPDLTSSMLYQRLARTAQQVPEIPNLVIVTSGPLPPNPAELLNSAQVTRVMAQLADHADLVIYDSPPASMVTDPAILGANADAVILVARARATRGAVLLSAKAALERVGVERILPVLNAAAPRDMRTYPGVYRYYESRPARPEDLSRPLPDAGPALAPVARPESVAQGGARNVHPDDPTRLG